MQDALEHLLEGRTSLIVAHRLSTILNANQILVIHNGELVEQGNHAELLGKAGLYAELFRLQFPKATAGASPVGEALSRGSHKWPPTEAGVAG